MGIVSFRKFPRYTAEHASNDTGTLSTLFATAVNSTLKSSRALVLACSLCLPPLQASCLYMNFSSCRKSGFVLVFLTANSELALTTEHCSTSESQQQHLFSTVQVHSVAEPGFIHQDKYSHKVKRTPYTRIRECVVPLSYLQPSTQNLQV